MLAADRERALIAVLRLEGAITVIDELLAPDYEEGPCPDSP